MKSIGRIEKLFTYPIKSCATVRVDSFEVDRNGPKYDREFLIVSSNGKFISQRSHPALSKLSCKVLSHDHFVLNDGQNSLKFKNTRESKPQFSARIWQDEVGAYEVDQNASEFISDFLGDQFRLVSYAESSPRVKSKSGVDYTANFPDSAPFLLMNNSTVERISEDLGETITFDRFRPNIVATFEEPFLELKFKKLRIGTIDFPIAYGCTRCKMIDINQTTGEKDRNLLKHLIKNQSPEEPVAGIRLIHKETGRLSIGDEIWAEI